MLCRDEIALIDHYRSPQERTAFVCQLRAALAAAGKRKWEKFLHTHKRYRRETY